MVKACSALNCNLRDTTENRKRGLSFHQFPKDESLRAAWARATKREGIRKGTFWIPSASAYLCSNHFLQRDFEVAQIHKRLREGVIPSVFNFGSKTSIQNVPSKSCQSMKRSTNNVSGKSVQDLLPNTGTVEDVTEIEASSCSQSGVLRAVTLPTTPSNVMSTTTPNIDHFALSSNVSAGGTDITSTGAKDNQSAKPDKNTHPGVTESKLGTFLDFVAKKLHNIKSANMLQLAQIKIVNILEEIEMHCKEQSLEFSVSKSKQPYLTNEIKKAINKKHLANGVSNSTQAIQTNKIKRDCKRKLTSSSFNSTQVKLTNVIEQKNSKVSSPSSVFGISQTILTNKIEEQIYEESLMCDDFDSNCTKLSNKVQKQDNFESFVSTGFDPIKLKLTNEIEALGQKTV